MSKYERVVRIGEIDTETGVFLATLATEGEASDGHILAIKGMRVPPRMPLLPSHWNDPTVVLGSLTKPEKALDEKPPRLRATGEIEMDGKGMPLELRQDLAHMISKGHVTGMSIRWDDVPGHPPVRRINLPSDHPFFVDADKEKSSAKRWGLYFEHSQALEGSIVALGADKQALIGRADETDGTVSTYWRSMAEHVEEEPGRIDTQESERYEHVEIDKPDPEADADDAGRVPTTLAGLRVQIAECREADIPVDDISEALWDTLSEEEQARCTHWIMGTSPTSAPSFGPTDEDCERLAELLTRLEVAEARATAAEAALEEERVRDDSAPSIIDQERVETGDPLQPLVTRPRELISYLREELEKASERVNAKFRAEIQKARGRIDND